MCQLGKRVGAHRRSDWATSPGCQATRGPCLAVGFSIFNNGYQQQLPASDTEQKAFVIIVLRPGLASDACKRAFELVCGALFLSM